jgi:hypothetical protein
VKAYYDSLSMLKLALLDARKWAEKVVDESHLTPEASAYLWNTLMGAQCLVREEANRVEALLPETEDGYE